MAQQQYPTETYYPFGKDAKVEVHLFGRPLNWSPKDDEGRQRIGEQAAALGVFDVLSPVPIKFNAKICDESQLTDVYYVGSNRQVSLRRGVEADGVMVKPGQAFFLGSADCATLLVYDPETTWLVCCHAGRDSLIDRNELRGKERRLHNTVVEAAVSCFMSPRVPLLRAFVCASIGAEHFEHRFSEHAENKAMVERFAELSPDCVKGDPAQGHISLVDVIKTQLVDQGLKPEAISSDEIDTYSDKNLDGSYRYWSHRRWVHGGKQEVGGGDGRNGVLVIHRAQVP